MAHGGAAGGRLLYATPTVEHLARFGARYEEWGIYMSDERPTGVPAERPRPARLASPGRLDRKVAALRAMATQTQRRRRDLDLALYAAQNAEEAFVDAANP